MKKKLLNVTGNLLCLFILLFSACDDKKDKNEEVEPEQEKGIVLDNSMEYYFNEGMNLNQYSDGGHLSFLAHEEWYIDIAQTRNGTQWCQVHPLSGGPGYQDISIVAEPNEGYDDRSVSLTLKAGTFKKTMMVTQKGKNALLITKNMFEVSREGEIIEVKVKANIPYRFHIDQPGWIKDETPNARALEESTHRFKIDANNTTDQREGNIYFEGQSEYDPIHEVVTIYQEGEHFVLLNKKEYTVGAKEETLFIDVNSNFEYTIKMPEVDWLREDKGEKAMSSHRLHFRLDANDTHENRYAEIIFYDKSNTAIADTARITQAQKNAIIITHKNLNIDAKGGTIEVTLNSNVDVEEIMPSVRWIEKAPEVRSMSPHKFRYIISENTTYDERRTRIIYHEQGNRYLADTLYITQDCIRAIIVGKKEYNIPVDGKQIDIRINSNIDYNVKMPDVDWITPSPGARGLQTDVLYYTIAANNTYDNRSAEIIYHHPENRLLADTVRVNQVCKQVAFFTKKEYEVAPTGGRIEVEVNYNGDYYIYNKPGWITQAPETRGLTKDKLSFIVEANGPDSDRTGLIVVQSSSNRLRDTLTVFQNTYVSKKMVHVSPAGMLSELIDPEEKFLITDLTLTGKLNGTDIKYIRDMGIHSPSLRTLDLTGADIVAGGSVYYVNHKNISFSTEDNVLGAYMFYEFKRIKSIKLPDGITAIGSHSLGICSNLPSIYIPERVKTIGNNAISSCSSLVSVVLSDQVESIGNEAFYACSKLASVKFSSNLKDIGNSAFYQCRELTTVTLPETILHIGRSAFSDCSKLSTINMTHAITTIGQFAFSGTDLKSITLGRNLSTIDGSAFSDCDNLKEISVASGNSIFTSIGGVLYKADTLVAYPNAKADTYVIPDRTTVVGNYAFSSRNSLTTVTIPKSIVAIGYNSFNGCRNLKEVYAKGLVVPELGYNAFYNSRSLYHTLYVPKGKYTDYWNSKWGDNYFLYILEEE